MLALDTDTNANAGRGKCGRKQRIYDTADKITALALVALLESQKFKCAITGRPLTPETASIDHRVAVSRGGSNTMPNIQIVHREVNQAKRAMSMEDFIAMCREVVAYADARGN